MKNITYIDKPIIPTRNRVIVKVEDTYDLKKSKGGILMANAADEEAEANSEGHNLSEWIIRSGVVEKMPRVLTRSGYDWEPNDEVKEGDVVFWPIFRFFNYPVIKNFKDETFLVVDYHDIYAKKVDNVFTPVNGYCLFKPIEETVKFLEHEVDKPTPWYTLEKMGDDVVFGEERFNIDYPWKEGDKCLMSVPPFQMEADVDKEFNYYLAQKRHIVLSI